MHVIQSGPGLPAAPPEGGEWDSVQAIILAAGGGSRLNGAAAAHKCQVRFEGRTLLDYQLGLLAAHGIRDVCIVSGYNRDTVMGDAAGRAHFIHNDAWADSNSLYSLWLCRAWVDRPLVVMNCDVLVHPEVLERVLATARVAGAGFAYDSDSGHDEEHMKVRLNDGLLHAMSKQLDPEVVHGENVGMLCFGREAARRLFAEAEVALRTRGRGVWVAAAVERLARRVDLHGVDVAGLPWIEIDFPEDLEAARRDIWPRVRGAARSMPEPRMEAPRCAHG